MKRTVFFLMLLISVFSMGQAENKEKDFCFHIYITDGFESDSIDLMINSKLILDNVTLTSHPILGITKQYVRAYTSDKGRNLLSLEIFDNKSLCVKKRKKQLIQVKYSGSVYSFEFDLLKGKYLLITKNIHSDTIKFQQLDIEPGFS